MIKNKQFTDRNSFIGGSDVPVIFGVSKFKTPFELALEKAGIREKTFTGNIYTEVGNILEPIIQKKMKVTNMDDIEYSKDNGHLPFKAHIDGIIGDDLVEIKVISGDADNAERQYDYQIQTYLMLSGMNKCQLLVLNKKKEERINSIIREISEKYELKYDTNFDKIDEESVTAIKAELSKLLTFDELDSGFIEQKEVYIDKNKTDEILTKCKIFGDFVKELKDDIFFNDENEDEYLFMQNRLNEKLGLTTSVVNYDFSEIEKIEKQLKKFKEIEKKYKAEKEKLLEFMKKNDIKKIDNDKFTISIKRASERRTFDKKKFEEINGEISENFYKKTIVNESLTIKLKENNE